MGSTAHHGQKRAPQTEKSTMDRKEHHKQNRLGQDRTQSHTENHSRQEQETVDGTESDGIRHNHTQRTEPFTQTERHRQNRIGQTNRMNRLKQDRSQSHGQNKIGQNNGINRTDHNHMDRLHHSMYTKWHDYTKRPSRAKRALIVYKEGGGAQMACHLAQRGDMHEHHGIGNPAQEKKPKEGDRSNQIVAD